MDRLDFRTASIEMPVACGLFVPDEDHDAPQPVVVAVVGKWTEHPSGGFEITNDDLASIVKNFNAIPDNRLLFDVDHRSLFGETEAYGWGSNMRIDGDRLLVDVVWTSDMTRDLASKKYRWLSPVFFFNAKDRRTGKPIGTVLGSVALTNRPFLQELPPVVNHYVNYCVNETSDIQEDKMNEAEMKAKIAELEDQNRQLASELQAERDQAVTREVDNAAVALGLNDRQKRVALSLRKVDIETYRVYLDGIRQSAADGGADQAEALVNAAINSRKILPAQKDFALALAHMNKDLYEGFVKSNQMPALDHVVVNSDGSSGDDDDFYEPVTV